MFINFYKFDATIYRVLRRRVYGNNKYIFTRTCVISKILCYIKLTLTTSAKIRRCLLVLFILSVCLRSHSRLIKLKKKHINNTFMYKHAQFERILRRKIPLMNIIGTTPRCSTRARNTPIPRVISRAYRRQCLCQCLLNRRCFAPIYCSDKSKRSDAEHNVPERRPAVIMTRSDNTLVSETVVVEAANARRFGTTIGGN